ncbi:MAG: AMMECR1 domain-containing protein [Spirochaetes bacterium]|nr:AMMECR1 domain-containing protein [Spirochaetota bacterium]
MFVTLSKGKKVRGCYGAFSHSITDGESLLSDYLTGALTRDPRYRPLDISELRNTRIIITITSQPFPVNDIGSIDLQYYGVMLQCGNSAAIYVPAEIKSMQYIEKIMRGSSCQVYGFRAVTLQQDNHE